MTPCPQCGNDNSVDSLYCWACGASLAPPVVSPGTITSPNAAGLSAQPLATQSAAGQFCASCGSLIAADAAFCSECGRPAQAGVAPVTDTTPAAPPMIAPLPDAKRTCENCGSVVAADAVFCPECGRSTKAGVSPPTDTPPNVAAPVAATPADSTWTAPSPHEKRICENCGSVVATDAVFCPECGRSTKAGVSPPTDAPPNLAAPVAATPADSTWTAPSVDTKRFCENCGSLVAADAVFCPECGRSIEAGVSPATHTALHLDSSATAAPAEPAWT